MVIMLRLFQQKTLSKGSFFKPKGVFFVQIHTGFSFSKASCTECCASAIAKPSFTELENYFFNCFI